MAESKPKILWEEFEPVGKEKFKCPDCGDLMVILQEGRKTYAFCINCKKYWKYCG